MKEHFKSCPFCGLDEIFGYLEEDFLYMQSLKCMNCNIAFVSNDIKKKWNNRMLKWNTLDNLPENNGNYLVKFKDWIGVCHFYKENNTWLMDDYETEALVSHWMSLDNFK